MSFVSYARQGYHAAVTFVDDTLNSGSGEVVMNHRHGMMSGADFDYTVDPEIIALRARLRRLVDSSTTSAYAKHLEWLVDSSDAAVRSPDSVEIKLQIAENLEFNLRNPTDSAKLIAYDAALGGHAYELHGVPGASHVTVLDSATYWAPSMLADRRPNAPSTLNRRRAAAPRKTDVGQSARPVTILFVNGMRVALNDVTASNGNLKFLSSIVRGDPALSDAQVTFFYNRNLAAQMAHLDTAFACAGDFARGSRIRTVVTLAAEFVNCRGTLNGAKVVLAPGQSDYSEVMLQYANLVLGVTTPEPVDVGSLAGRLAAYYNRDSSDVIFVSHSQGNMTMAQAMREFRHASDLYFTTDRCVTDLALASPVPTSVFGIAAPGVISKIVNNDILFLLTPIQNDGVRYNDDRSQMATAAIDSTHSWDVFRRLMLRFQWGLQIHEVSHNYFQYPTTRSAVDSALVNLRSYCASRLWP